MSEHPLSIQVITRDPRDQKEVRREYVVSTKHPRWEILKIFIDLFFRARL